MLSNRPLRLNNPTSRFELEGDKEHFDRIVRDMLENGGDLAPSDHWNWNLGETKSGRDTRLTGYTDDLFKTKYKSLKMMLNPWVGVTGMKLIDETAITKYESFLRSIDHLGLVPDDVKSHGQANGWIEADLGSIMDVNLLAAFMPESPDDRISICEVGGGYGRLAEVILGSLWESAHYVLVDAVPGSLMYAFIYLRAQFPDRLIGSYYNGDAYGPEFDCYIMPAWRTHDLPEGAFDTCINVESMQEMAQHHVDYYLGMFDRIARRNAAIYLSNARDYVFTGNWNMPRNWETLFLHNTPRSWTAEHPTHILRNGEGDFALRRKVIEGAYRQQVYAWEYSRTIDKQQRLIADRDSTCQELKRKISDQEKIINMREPEPVEPATVAATEDRHHENGFLTRLRRTLQHVFR